MSLFLFQSSISVKQVTKFSISFIFRRCLRKMEGLEISEMRVEPCVDSRFILPSRVVFKQVSIIFIVLHSLVKRIGLYTFSDVSLDLLAALFLSCLYSFLVLTFMILLFSRTNSQPLFLIQNLCLLHRTCTVTTKIATARLQPNECIFH